MTIVIWATVLTVMAATVCMVACAFLIMAEYEELRDEIIDAQKVRENVADPKAPPKEPI